MKKRIATLLLFILVFVLTSCKKNTSLNTESYLRIEEFVSYFNHNIDYKIGTVTEQYKTVICEDGTELTFEYPGAVYSYETAEENAALSMHHMVGSLEMESPYDSGEKIIVFFLKGKDGVNYVKSRSPITISNVFKNRYPSFSGNNRFGEMTPQEYFINFENVIRDTLKHETNLEILTVQDAAQAIINIENQNFSDFTVKETECYEKYYHNEKDRIVYFPKIELMVALSESKNAIADIYDIENYYFTVYTNLDYYYRVYIDGTIEKRNKFVQ